MDDLQSLESQTIHIVREAFARFERAAMLWSFGKDSQALLWMVRKAFFGRVPFPVVHVDTSYEPPEMLAFRDRIAKEWALNLVVARHDEALAEGMAPTRGRLACCTALKTEALHRVVARRGYDAVLAGIRRDEEGTRAKERVFSPRGSDGAYDAARQPPEFWGYGAGPRPGGHVRIHPLLHWSEEDVWRYIAQEGVPVPDLYFASAGKRYRSLGCAPCTKPVASRAADVEGILAELRETRVAERTGRLQDQEAEDTFERLRAAGHM